MAKFLLIIITFLIFTDTAYGGVTNKNEADQFLKEYCIELIGSIKDSYLIQKKAVKDGDWQTFSEKGHWIAGVSDIYSKLCK